MLGSKIPNSDRKPSSIEHSHRGDRLWSGPPLLCEVAEGPLLHEGGLSAWVWNFASEHVHISFALKPPGENAICELMENSEFSFGCGIMQPLRVVIRDNFIFHASNETHRTGNFSNSIDAWPEYLFDELLERCNHRHQMINHLAD